MRYFKLYDEDNHLLGIGTGLDGIEISKEYLPNVFRVRSAFRRR